MSELVYTIGHTTTYDKCLLREKPLMKLGRDVDYGGGAIWKTSEEAYKFLETYENGEIYSAYEIELPTNWESDVDESLYDMIGHNSLINSARILRKVDKTK